MRPDRTLPPSYFEAMFQGDPDPWGLESRAYEAEKFDATVAALGGRTYACAFEVGCAGGSLTRRLAQHCSQLLAIDVSETALERARRKCADQPQVRFERMVFPQSTPDIVGVDLIVLSEVAYYWDDADLARAGMWMRDTDYPQTGDGAVHALHSLLGDRVETVVSHRETAYRLDLWRAV